jgi:hypothetical protein
MKSVYGTTNISVNKKTFIELGKYNCIYRDSFTMQNIENNKIIFLY